MIIKLSLNINLEVYKENVSKELNYMYSKDLFENARNILADTNWRIVEYEIYIIESWAKFFDIFDGVVRL